MEFKKSKRRHKKKKKKIQRTKGTNRKQIYLNHTYQEKY